MVGRRIDLSKSIPKDSPFLKTLAEQLTLMEFSIYAAIQRRYTYCICTYSVKSGIPIGGSPRGKCVAGNTTIIFPEYQMLLGAVVC